MSKFREKLAAVSTHPGESSSGLVVNTPDSEYSQDYYDKAYRTAQQLIGSLPVVQTNQRVIELARDIKAGLFEDISSLEDAANHWGKWLTRTRDLYAARGIAIQADLPHDPTFKKLYTGIYYLAKQLIQQLPMQESEYRVAELARAIRTGAFDDISDIEAATENWGAWLARTKQFFRDNRTLLADSRKK